jgi:hypothetical protein
MLDANYLALIEAGYRLTLIPESVFDETLKGHWAGEVIAA